MCVSETVIQKAIALATKLQNQLPHMGIVALRDITIADNINFHHVNGFSLPENDALSDHDIIYTAITECTEGCFLIASLALYAVQSEQVSF